MYATFLFTICFHDSKLDKKPLLEDEDFDEEGYGPTAIRHVEILSPDTVKEAECRLLFVPSLLAGLSFPLSQTMLFSIFQ